MDGRKREGVNDVLGLDASVTLGDVLYVAFGLVAAACALAAWRSRGRKDDKESIEALAQIKADTSTTRRDVTVICSKLDKLADRSDDHERRIGTLETQVETQWKRHDELKEEVRNMRIGGKE